MTLHPRRRNRRLFPIVHVSSIDWKRTDVLQVKRTEAR